MTKKTTANLTERKAFYSAQSNTVFEKNFLKVLCEQAIVGGFFYLPRQDLIQEVFGDDFPNLQLEKQNKIRHLRLKFQDLKLLKIVKINLKICLILNPEFLKDHVNFEKKDFYSIPFIEKENLFQLLLKRCEKLNKEKKEKREAEIQALKKIQLEKQKEKERSLKRNELLKNLKKDFIQDPFPTILIQKNTNEAFLKQKREEKFKEEREKIIEKMKRDARWENILRTNHQNKKNFLKR